MQRRTPIKVILDTDPGVDDALAILLALASPELEVLAITTVCGNVPVGQATKNLFRLLSLSRTPSGLLVGQGAARPLQEALVTACQVHGSDGFGELDRLVDAAGAPRYAPGRLPAVLPTAQDVWSDCVRRYPGEITLLALGPLTNLAVGLKVNALTVHKFHSVIAMGGAFWVPGNVASAAEFNVYVDPHAADRVFQAALPFTLIPLDVTMRAGVTREALVGWAAASPDPQARLVSDLTEKAFTFAESVEGHGRFFFHDPLAVLAAVEPSLFTFESVHVGVETAGQVARGVTIADRRPRKPELKVAPNMSVALDVNAERALALLRTRLCPWS